MRVDRFKYDLPEELIAQEPLKERDESRIMTLVRSERSIDHSGRFRDIIRYFKKGDILVMNNTRVVNARLFGKRKTGGKVEIFVLEPYQGKGPYKALLRSSRRLRKNEEISLESGHLAKIIDESRPTCRVVFNAGITEILKSGHVPLPPYIKRSDKEIDHTRYQTVYADKPGATAAPTAGLHFTEALLDQIREIGVDVLYVTLHTGFGTFQPVKAKNVEEHEMHEEYFSVREHVAGKINSAKEKGGRVVAVGSTSTRVLETSLDEEGRLLAQDSYSDLFIYPPYDFRMVDAMITNFHLPGSTLLMMVCAFAGTELTLKAYKSAVRQKYRFFSYGDAMFIT